MAPTDLVISRVQSPIPGPRGGVAIKGYFKVQLWRGKTEDSPELLIHIDIKRGQKWTDKHQMLVETMAELLGVECV